MYNSPAVISSSPAIIRSVVDFPHPDGPTKMINSLSAISRLKKTVEIAFYSHISRETEWTLFPGDIFKRMENRFDAEIEDLSPELQGNIEEVISNMIDYFRMEKLLDPDTEFDS